jgi:hypothetical protein
MRSALSRPAPWSSRLFFNHVPRRRSSGSELRRFGQRAVLATYSLSSRALRSQAPSRGPIARPAGEVLIKQCSPRGVELPAVMCCTLVGQPKSETSLGVRVAVLARQTHCCAHMLVHRSRSFCPARRLLRRFTPARQMLVQKRLALGRHPGLAAPGRAALVGKPAAWVSLAPRDLAGGTESSQSMPEVTHPLLLVGRHGLKGIGTLSRSTPGRRRRRGRSSGPGSRQQ